MKIDIKNLFSGVVRWAKDHKSDLKMGIGTASTVVGTVVLCRSAVKVSKIIDEYREAKKELIVDEAEPHDIHKLTVKTVGKVTLTLLPGAAVEAGGLGLMWSGYSDAKAVIAGLSGTCASLYSVINQCREHVREKYGEEAEEEMMYQFRTEEITVRNDDGTDRIETVRVYPHEASAMPSMYARYFAYREADGAEPSLDYNGRFLQLQENLFNNYLKAHRKLMLNDVYRMLGIKQSKAGNHVGWVFDPEFPEGDNQIKLRARKVWRDRIDMDGEPNGIEEVWMIDPNVDGMVEDKMVRLGLIDE